MDSRRLEIVADVGFSLFVGGWDAVITENGISGNENLPFVRWVGERFGIAGHGGIEHDFAGTGCFIAERAAFENSPVLKSEEGFS